MNLKEILIKTNTKQSELCKALNINKTTLSNYVNNKTQPDDDTLLKIADYLNVTLDYLFGRPFNHGVGFIPNEKKEIVKMLLELNETDFMQVSGYIRYAHDKPKE